MNLATAMLVLVTVMVLVTLIQLYILLNISQKIRILAASLMALECVSQVFFVYQNSGAIDNKTLQTKALDLFMERAHSSRALKHLTRTTAEKIMESYWILFLLLRKVYK